MRKPIKEINVTVKLIPHPNPQLVIDMLARNALEMILKNEESNAYLAHILPTEAPI